MSLCAGASNSLPPEMEHVMRGPAVEEAEETDRQAGTGTRVASSQRVLEDSGMHVQYIQQYMYM